MKIIGKISGDTYIAEISHSELEKSTEKYYGNMPKLDVGSIMDIGAGYNFRGDIQKACRDMQSAVKAFEQAQATMLRFAVMVGDLPEDKTDPT